jgi:protein SCO1/2
MHYFAAQDTGDGGPNDFLHTENLVLVDKEKRLRGFYDGTNYDQIDQLKEDIAQLKEEYE